MADISIRNATKRLNLTKRTLLCNKGHIIIIIEKSKNTLVGQ